jgi:hypothetical protein
MDGTTSESKLTYSCKYCDKEFRKESTLAAHLCEQKRRWQQEKETGVQWGLQAYLRFYELTQGSARLKSYADFVTSPYYSAFVRYGRYQVTIRSINHSSFTEWLLKNNKKLDHWCKDSLYEEWLHDYVKRENVQDALERGIREMQAYAEDHPELKNGYVDYFRYGNHNRICFHITTGRLSPWVLYNCDSGVDFLSSVDGHAVELIMPWIDPDHWQKKFADYMADTEWAKHMLAQAGL